MGMSFLLSVAFAIFDCFNIKHNQLGLKGRDSMSKTFTSLLYLLRMGIVACASMMINGNYTKEADEMIKQSKKERATNLLSPWISTIKAIQAKHEKKTTTLINPHGDISYFGMHVTHAIYSQLIPSVKNMMGSLFSRLFRGNDWKVFLDPTSTIDIIDDWYHDNNVTASSTTSTNCINLKSLQLRQEREDIEFFLHQLISEIELTLYGLSGGGERLSTIHNIDASQLQLHGDHIYFRLVHDKQASVMSKRATSNRKHMPPSLVPYFFLYRRICIILKLDSEGKVVPSIEKRQDTMIQAFCRHLQLSPSNLKLLHIRQFFNAVTNIAYDVDKNEIIADDVGAMANNHSPSVHRKSYGSRKSGGGCEFTRFTGYHQQLGEVPYLPPAVGSLQLTEERALKALCLLLRHDNAKFHGDAQKNMILQCCPTRRIHQSFILPCGLGKSMSVMIPVAFEKMNNLFCGCRIVIVPYGFLMDSLFVSIRETMQCLQVSIDTCDGTQITSNNIPFATQDDLPDILIITVNAASNLITHHRDKLSQWCDDNVVRGIWIDEAQAIYEEFSFRSNVYKDLQRLAEFTIPIKLMSGSMTASTMMMLMMYLGLQNNTEDTTPLCSSDNSSLLNITEDSNMIDGSEDTSDLVEIPADEPQNLLGFNFSFIIQITTNVIQHTIDLVVKYTNEHNKSCHVICASKVILRQFEDQMKDDSTASFVDSDTNSTVRCLIAKEWYSGKVKILFTSTCGLVGNENKAVGAIFIVGKIYSLSNLLQAIGRLRPKYRGNHSIVYQICTPYDKINKSCTNTNKIALKASKLLLPQHEDEYESVFGSQGYVDLLNSKECLVTFLRKRFGEKCHTKCQLCSNCRQHCLNTQEIAINKEDFTPNDSDSDPYTNHQMNNLIHNANVVDNTYMNPQHVNRLPIQDQEIQVAASFAHPQVAAIDAPPQAAALVVPPIQVIGARPHIGGPPPQLLVDHPKLAAVDVTHNQVIGARPHIGGPPTQVPVSTGSIHQNSQSAGSTSSKVVADPNSYTMTNSTLNPYIRKASVSFTTETDLNNSCQQSTHPPARAMTGTEQSLLTQIHPTAPTESGKQISSTRLTHQLHMSRSATPGMGTINTAKGKNSNVILKMGGPIVTGKHLIQRDLSMETLSKKTKLNMLNLAQTEQQAIQVLNQLNNKCLLCNNQQCDGTCQTRRHQLCYHCGLKHPSKNCDLGFKTKQRNQLQNALKHKGICMSCYGVMNDGSVHGWVGRILNCPMKERLKYMIINEYNSKNRAEDMTLR